MKLNNRDMRSRIFILLALMFFGTSFLSYSQDISVDYQGTSGKDDGSNEEQANIISTAVPFLTIAPDSRAAAMGDVGVATSPDLNSMHWNPAKFAFIDGEVGVSLSYVPWLKALVNDINLYYLTGYKKFGKFQTLSGSLLYFSLGEIQFTNNEGANIRTVEPNEYAIDLAYTRLFSRYYSMSVAGRYIRSDLSKGSGTTDLKPGNTAAVDVAAYYQRDIKVGTNDGSMSYGINISNIGATISYSEDDELFIPTNMRLGGALKVDIDDYNSLAFALDFNKLLVPTPPILYPDSSDSDENQVVMAGEDNSGVSIPQAIFRSFVDAPGVEENGSRNVLKEELREVNIGFGLEYWYAKQFAIRGGYFYEHATKGNRKYFTLGLGLKLNVFALDLSYIVPQHPGNPLANTIRFSLLFDFEPIN